MAPTTTQFGLLAAALAMLAAAFVLALFGLGAERRRRRLAGRLATLAAMAVDLGLVFYRSLALHDPATGQRIKSCPIENNFDSAVLFAVMLGGLLFYLLTVMRGRLSRRARLAGEDRGCQPVRSVIDLVLLPLMIAVQSAGAAVYLFDLFTPFARGDLWRPLHLASLIVGSLFFAAAAVAATMYLLADRSLRRMRPGPSAGGLPSLERLEALVQHAVLAGFPLLTFGIITGVLIAVRQMHAPAGEWLRWPKVWASAAAWLAFAVVLHVHFVPRFRGRRAAWFSILGFALMLAAYVVVHAKLR